MILVLQAVPAFDYVQSVNHQRRSLSKDHECVTLYGLHNDFYLVFTTTVYANNVQGGLCFMFAEL